MVEQENKGLPLSQQADLLGLSRSSLYYQPGSPSEKEIRIKHRIDEIYTQYPFYGSRRIHQQLRREGEVVGENTIAKYMREMGIADYLPWPKPEQAAKSCLSTTRSGLDPDPSRIRFGALTLPLSRLQKGWMYLVAILDWFSAALSSAALSHSGKRKVGHIDGTWPNVAPGVGVKRRLPTGLEIQRRIVQARQYQIERLRQLTQLAPGVINTAYIERLNATFRSL